MRYIYMFIIGIFLLGVLTGILTVKIFGRGRVTSGTLLIHTDPIDNEPPVLLVELDKDVESLFDLDTITFKVASD